MSRRARVGVRGGVATAFLAVLVASTHSEAAAQHRAQPAAGDWVTIYTPEVVHWTVEGELLSLTPESLRVRPRDGGDPVTLSREAVQRFRVSEGRRRATWRGAFIGVFVGFIVGEAIVAAERADGELDPDCGEQSCRGWGTRLLWTGAGIGTGAFVGSRFHYERWRDLPVADLRPPRDGSGGPSY